MVNISMTPTYIATPLVQNNIKGFLIQLGSITNFIIPSPDNAATTSADAAMRNGSPYMVNIRPYETFPIDNEIFQLIVNSAKGGGDTSFVSKIIYLVNRGNIQVQQDNAAPMTSDQILAYTAP